MGSLVTFRFFSERDIFFLSKRTDDGVFIDFHFISHYFPRMFENLQFFRRSEEHTRTVFYYFSKVSEGASRLKQVAEDFLGRPTDVSILHQTI